jgi:hypothetical protein
MNNLKIADYTSRVNEKYAWAVCFLIAYVSSFILSGVSAPLPDLDRSYQVVLEYARVNDFQFGRDIVFTFGPLGFLNTWVSQGFFPDQRIMFALAWSGITAWSATGLARQIPGSMKFVFLVWFLIYSNFRMLDLHASLVMLYGCMVLMGNVQERKCASSLVLVFFAVLALIKFTFLMAATVGIVTCVLVHMCKRNYRTSAIILLSFVSIFITLWVLTGQKCENLLPWLKGSYEIVAGYNEAMAIFPKTRVLFICTIAGAMYLTSLIVVISSASMEISRLGILAVTSAYVFLSWKHGFVRADGHVMSFIFFLPLAYSVLLSEVFQKTMNGRPRRYLATMFMGVVILCNWAADFQEPGTMLTKFIYWPQSMINNSRLILNAASGRWENCFEALRTGQKLQRFPDLPVVRALVGKSSVDVVNYTQWAALANDLNYHPRPVIQGYAAYTPYLQDINLAYYKSKKRPEYVLFKMETIDGRFPTLDDASLLIYILGNYKPVAKEGGFFILKSSLDSSRDAELFLIHEQDIVFGESLDMSAYKNRTVIMKVAIRPTILGRIVKGIFQPPIVTLNTKVNGKPADYRFIPSIAERGFVISPLLLTDKDVSDYYDGAIVSSVDSISFSMPEYASVQLSNKISVQLYLQKNSDGGTL